MKAISNGGSFVLFSTYTYIPVRKLNDEEGDGIHFLGVFEEIDVGDGFVPAEISQVSGVSNPISDCLVYSTLDGDASRIGQML